MTTTPARVDILNKLADLILQNNRPHPLRVAIDGVDAAGKTILADELAPIIEKRKRPVIRASIDSFHNPRSTRYRRGASSPGGYYYDSFDYPTLIKILLSPLGPSGDCRYRKAAFDFRRDSAILDPPSQAPIEAVLLMDGVFLMRQQLLEYWDYRVYIEVDFEVALKRAETRDLELFGSIDAVRRRYRERYIPGQRLYLQSAQPKLKADAVLNNNYPEEPELIISV